MLISCGKASLKELETYYSLEDAYTLYEVIIVDNHNEHMHAEHAKRKHGRRN